MFKIFTSRAVPRLLAVVASITVFGLAAASAVHAKGKPPQYFVDEEKLPFEALPGARALFGVQAGAGYRIEVPEMWNNKLVVWAHGFRGTGLELTVDNHPLRELLISLGYAWAASSYDRNDYDIASGVKSTHALINRFNGLVGRPSQILMTGASMGGHITGVLIEQYPELFDGAMPICGVVGDTVMFDYYLDFSVTAQQLGTGSSQFPLDPVTYLFATVPQIKSSLGSPWPFNLTPAGEEHKGATEQRSGGERPNFDNAFIYWNIIPSLNTDIPGNFLLELALSRAPKVQGNALENFQTIYQFDNDPELTTAEQTLNETIVRVAADPQSRRPSGLAQVPMTSGDISIPVLTLHNLGDLFVPVNNEVEYAKRVASKGASDLLVQRAIRGVGHCEFTQLELFEAFTDLVHWVDFGKKPAGDDFTNPEAVASDDFGCAFTRFTANDTEFPDELPSESNGGHVWADAEACATDAGNTAVAF